MKMKNGFTLIEVLVVTIIIGILSTLSISYYTAAKENVADREAASALKNIQVAEKSYFLDTGTYYPPAGSENTIGTINANLKLALPTAATRNWDYAAWSTGCARATRVGGGRSWFLTITDGSAGGTDGEPDSGAGCP